MSVKRLATVLFLVIFFVFLLFSIWILFHFNSFIPPAKVWRGYYTVVFKLSGNKKLLIQRLREKRYLKGIVSVYTSPVMFYDFSGFKWVTIDRLDRYLDREDPRYDDYLRNAGNFFVAFSKGERYEIIYIPAVERPIVTYVKLTRLFSGIGIPWYFIDYSPLLSGFSILLFLIFSVFLIKGYNLPRGIDSSNMLWIPVGIIPWVLIMIDGNIAVTGFAFAFFPLYISLSAKVCESVDGYFPSRGNGENWVKELLLLAGVLLFAFLVMIAWGLGFRCILPLSWALMFDSVLIGFVVLHIKIKRFLYSHNVFKPVKILGDFFVSTREPIGRKFRLFAIGTFALFVVVVFAAERSFNNFIIPQPRKLHIGRGLSEWQRFESLWRMDREIKLPNLSDYIAHWAYQETLQFNYDICVERGGRDWFPRENSVICLRKFSYDRYKNKIFGRKIIVKYFDENWLKGILLEIKNNSFEKIIENQGGTTTVNYFPVRKLPYWKLYPPEFLVLIFVLVWYLFFFDWNWRFSAKISYDFGRLYEES